MSEQTEIQLMRLYCKTEALEHLLQFVAFALAQQDRDLLRRVFEAIPNSTTVLAASRSVMVGGIPPPFNVGAHDRIFEETLVGVFEQFKHNTLELLADHDRRAQGDVPDC